jgi:hypothetical protein
MDATQQEPTQQPQQQAQLQEKDQQQPHFQQTIFQYPPNAATLQQPAANKWAQRPPQVHSPPYQNQQPNHHNNHTPNHYNQQNYNNNQQNQQRLPNQQQQNQQSPQNKNNKQATWYFTLYVYLYFSSLSFVSHSSSTFPFSSFFI